MKILEHITDFITYHRDEHDYRRGKPAMLVAGEVSQKARLLEKDFVRYEGQISALKSQLGEAGSQLVEDSLSELEETRTTAQNALWGQIESIVPLQLAEKTREIHQQHLLEVR